MKKNISCDYCGLFLASDHGCRRGAIIIDHFKKCHPDEYREMVEAKKVLVGLRKKYKFLHESYLTEIN